jgi:hypothetical protein
MFCATLTLSPWAAHYPPQHIGSGGVKAELTNMANTIKRKTQEDTHEKKVIYNPQHTAVYNTIN